MPGSERAEIYFIAAMMILILIISGVSVFFFFRQYRIEMKKKSADTSEKAVIREPKEAVGGNGNEPS